MVDMALAHRGAWSDDRSPRTPEPRAFSEEDSGWDCSTGRSPSSPAAATGWARPTASCSPRRARRWWSTTSAARATAPAAASRGADGGRGDQGRRRQGGRQRRRRLHRRRAARTSSRPPSTTSAGVDILVNNAGILRDKTFANTSEADWDAVVKVHLKGAYCVTMPVWNWMKDNGGQGRDRHDLVDARACSATSASPTTARPRPGSTASCGCSRSRGASTASGVWALAPGAYTRMTSDLPGRKDREPDPMSLPDASRPACSTWSPTSPAIETGKVLGVSSRGVREIKMMRPRASRPRALDRPGRGRPRRRGVLPG